MWFASLGVILFRACLLGRRYFLGFFLSLFLFLGVVVVAMVDFFRSAISYLSGEGEAGGVTSGGSSFVGQTVDLGEGLKLKVKKVIAEGKPLKTAPVPSV